LKLTSVVLLLLLADPLALAAKEPLSAIDWLSKSVKPAAVPTLPANPLAKDATTTPITVTPLAAIRKDSVGLLPSSVSGLPHDFWRGSTTSTIVDLINRQKTDNLPELQSLLYTVLLAEVDAPQADAGGSTLLLARIDKLLDLGALDQAQALVERAGPTEAEIFRRWFDVSLLTGHEDHACTAMRAAPGFAPTLQARVFCLARGGDWGAAALTLATGQTLGFISKEDAKLIARFLDPDAFDGAPDLPPPAHLTPLVFAMREAIGQPRPPGALPLAFANADLKTGAAWRNEIEASERLVRSQAADARRLIEFYTERKPAASGGIWNRVEAIQALDLALLSAQTDAVAASLPRAYKAMSEVALEVPFSRYYGDRLATYALTGKAADIAFTVALLSDKYEDAPSKFTAKTPKQAFLLGLASGNVHSLDPPGTLGKAIADAFLAPMPEGELYDLLTQKRLGETILRAMLLLQDEAFADPGDIRAALSAFRAVGLESVARRTALQLLLLARRG